jgi:hypothetical protein
MAMNLEAVLRIAAKVVGLEEVTKLERAIGGAEKTAKDAKSAFAAVVGSAAWQGIAAAAAGVGVAIGLSTRAAIEFESSMADVVKVLDGVEPAGIVQIKQEIFSLAREVPLAVNEIAALYAAAAGSGVPRSELEQFARDVAKIAVAWDMSAAQAGESIAKLSANLGLSHKETMDLADAMNYLANNMGSSARTAADLTDFMLRAASSGKAAGLAATETAAFGAAMLKSGAQAEVAATSFNNMIRALSRGPSMTERQVDALRRLGYQMADAKQVESQLTREAEAASRRRVDAARDQKDQVIRLAQEQSDRRIEIARDETDRLSREINRRFRDELTALQDGWEDQARAQEDAARDRADAQIKALQRQERAEVDRIQKIAQAQKTDATAAVDQIRDAYESRIDAIRDQLDREMTVQRRAARDRQQVIRDEMDDRRDMELKANSDRLTQVEKQEDTFMETQKSAAENRFKALEDAEKQYLERAKVTAKKTGEERAKADMQGFTTTFQKNAIGTIRDVFARIRNLPKEMQISVISDLFGDEARALAPLINNAELLEGALGLVGDKAKYAASVNDEFIVKLATTASQMQLAKNQLDILGIQFGENFVKALQLAMKALDPVFGLLVKIMELPAVGPIFAGLAAGFVALAAAAPFIVSLISLFGTLKAALAGGAIVAALKTFVGAFVFAISKGLIPAFLGFISWIAGTFIPGLLAFLGPVGWTVLAVAAVVAMAIAFREPLMKFVSWLWKWTEFAREPFVRLWNAVVGIVTASLSLISRGIEIWGAEVRKIWSGDFSTLQGIVDTWRDAVVGIWTAMGEAFKTYLVEPIRNAWSTLTEFLPRAMETVRNRVVGVWTYVIDVIRNVFRGAMQFIANGINSLIDRVNYVIRGYNSIPVAPDIPQLGYVSVPAFAQGAVVTRPTLAMVGEGGEDEYVIPASKMQAASSRFLAGARGADVIPSRASSRSESGSASPQINVTTGPVMQQQDGSRWVSMDDFERGLQQVAEQVVGTLRTPQARTALGWS